MACAFTIETTTASCNYHSFKGKQMALTKCKECGKEVSDTAGKCPNCGAKVKKPMGVLGIVAIGIAIIALAKCSESANRASLNKSPPDPVAEARFQKTAAIARTIKNNLREPESMTLETARANDDASVVCLEYRARNGFGGMSKEFVVFAQNKAHQTPEAWNKHCTQPLFDMKHVRHAL